jgi:octaprenyl-diphosphate synthase
MPTALLLDELYRPVAHALAGVQNAVTDLWVDAMRLVHGDAIPRPKVGGKMLRPALCLLSAGAAGATDLEHYVPMATSMELLHLAALAHDDVVDGADYRRGARSLKAQWDSHTAVLGGDYLVARAIAILGTYDRCSVIVNAIGSVREMAEGELNCFGLGKNHFTHDGCISLARQKTASLFAVTCSTPTFLIDPTYRDTLHKYGIAVGVAFQIIDDVLDLCQESATLGKPACGDVVEGKHTLPLLYLRQASSSAEVSRLDSMIGHPITDDDREWIYSILEHTGAREKAEAIAREYADEARAYAEALPPSIYKDSMINLVDFVLSRGS